MLRAVPRLSLSKALVFLVVLGAAAAGCGDDSRVTFAPPSSSEEAGPQQRPLFVALRGYTPPWYCGRGAASNPRVMWPRALSLLL